MIGRRVDDVEPHLYQPGDYGRCGDLWMCRPPGPGELLGSLGNGTSHHQVTEHADGTITVIPSILISNHTGSWHGYLERGVWREC